MKRNPVVAVPVVLRRLKAKEEEWREAQKVNMFSAEGFIVLLKIIILVNKTVFVYRALTKYGGNRMKNFI